MTSRPSLPQPPRLHQRQSAAQSSRCVHRAHAAMLVILIACGATAVDDRALLAADAAGSNPQRVTSGLLALYDFTATEKSVARNQADSSGLLDLRIGDAAAVRGSADGLQVARTTLLRAEKPATKLVQAIQGSSQITLEAWVRPANLTQNGPARIVTLSRNPNERNFTLGQEKDTFEVRLRTTKTSGNGMPALGSKPKSVRAEWTHVVYTFDAQGRARIYLDGRLNAEQNLGGSLSNWDSQCSLGLANEITSDRPWHGSLRLVAVYNRALTAAEVGQNFAAGRIVDPAIAKRREERAKARHFETRIAPILATHCLECHDSTTKEGKLDLSRKEAAFAQRGGEPVIQAGKSAQSTLWTLVDADEMPQDRPPLSAEEKKLLKQWIDGGAVWSLDQIDPAIYVHGDGAQKVFVQRLTVPEYIVSVRDVLGVDITKEARELLPRDLRADGFSNTAYNLSVDLKHIEAYSQLAERIASRVDVAALARQHTKSRELTDENVTKVLLPVGRKLFRGPVSPEEVRLYCGLSTTVAANGGNFDDAIRVLLEAMLQSPRWLYRIEQQTGDGSPRLLNQYELAARLSYILWGGPPDEELLKAAEKETLDNAGLEKHAKRMLADPRAKQRALQFAAEWLNLGRLENLRPNADRFPDWESRLADDMRAETLAYFEELVWKQQRPLSELLNAPFTFVTPRLAKHYGLPIDPAAKENQLTRVDLANRSGRRGLLTQGSILTVGGDNASMVTRGLFVMHELLRGVVRNPPPCVDTTPVPSKPGLTQRMVSEQRIANQSCSGCHIKFEPLAFGFERFNGLGTFRETDEHGNRLREDGSLLVPGQEQTSEYRTTQELADLLANSERVQESLTWKLAQFALGRPLGATDARLMADVHHTAQQHGGTYASVMIAIVTSDLVKTTHTEAVGE